MTATGQLRLTLVRHGHAENNAPGHRDIDRALDRRGIAEVTEMARRCLDLGLVPDLLIASAALRTVQTADAFARLLERSPSQRLVDPSLYLAEASKLLERVRAVPDTIAHLMVVGHNPGLGDLAAQLSPAAPFSSFETAATCSMAFAAASWRQLRHGQAEDVRYDAPGRFYEPWI